MIISCIFDQLVLAHMISFNIYLLVIVGEKILLKQTIYLEALFMYMFYGNYSVFFSHFKTGILMIRRRVIFVKIIKQFKLRDGQFLKFANFYAHI